jgi:hypothetical protein
MAVPHPGQEEGGWTIDLPAGSLKMQTFRKLPIQMPKMKAVTSSR